jgi:hypothetical protein
MVRNNLESPVIDLLRWTVRILAALRPPFANPERIEHPCPKASEAAVVAGHESQIVRHGSGRHQPVDDRYWSDGAHAPPLVGDGIVDAEHATAERRLDLFKPPFQRRSLIGIARARKLDTLAYLAEDKRAQKEFVLCDRSVPDRN